MGSADKWLWPFAGLGIDLKTKVLDLLGRIVAIRQATGISHSLSNLSNISNPSRIISISSSMLVTHLLDSDYLAVVVD
jgi:hypothetical protein